MRLSHSRRQGMTLLEVILALAIFLFALAALSQLFRASTDMAVEVQNTSRATRLAQSKLGEYAGGVLNLQSGTTGSFDEEPGWQWSSDIQVDGTAEGLYLVTVSVSRDLTSETQAKTTISQYVLDPRRRGSIGTASTSSSGSMTDGTSTTGSTGTSSSTSGTGTTTSGTTSGGTGSTTGGGTTSGSGTGAGSNNGGGKGGN
ncbi:MAG: prepilin-type N-terminal cleavage/methylation domain-containing protein [Planctomycetes bacterium]|nr:prepilin-type N-terminal cleavage/methylation domain-containing protein [Planctomycetota bacterium]